MIPSSEKHALAQEALFAANEVRGDLGYTLEDPVCCYDACRKLGLIVRFVDINFEGFYQPGTPPRIYLSARRPLARRHFTCAHELGHHVFGHAAVIDELGDGIRTGRSKTAEEFLADVFAGHFLMPVLGMRKAFVRRGIQTGKADPLTLHAIASDFAVGYETLITHLTYGLNYIPESRYRNLLKGQKILRGKLCGLEKGVSIQYIDDLITRGCLDIEISNVIVIREIAQITGRCLSFIKNCEFGQAYRAQELGKAALQFKRRRSLQSVRVAPKAYVGLDKYRFIRNEDD